MEKEKLKMMTFRAPLEIWRFLKQTAIDQEESVNDIMLRCIENLKKNQDKKKKVDMM